MNSRGWRARSSQPINQLITIEGNEHDFDRHATPETLNVYQAVITFLEEA